MSKKQQTKPTPKPEPENTTLRGIITLAAGIGILLALLSFALGSSENNLMGLIGFGIGKVFHALFGISSYLLSLYVGWIGWRLLFNKPIHHPIIKMIYVVVLVGSLSILLSLVEDQLPALHKGLHQLFYPHSGKARFHLGGALFYFLYRDIPFLNLLNIFNTTGVAILCTATLLASLFFLTKTTPAEVLQMIARMLKGPERQVVEEAHAAPLEQEDDESTARMVKVRIPDQQPTKEIPHPPYQNDLMEIQPEQFLTERPSVSGKERNKPNLITDQVQEKAKPDRKLPEAKPATPEKKRKVALDAQRVHNGDFTSYAIPAPSLLTAAKKVDASALKQNLKRQAEVLEETLQSFGIEAKVGQINCGPTITSFEVHPSIGVKVQKIKTLENDIALNMEAKSIRIIAPIPGKAAVGIEVPNPFPQEVGFKDMLNSYLNGSRKFNIPVLLGKAANGDYVMNDLAKMPHSIIAGATGSGKSVCINTIIMTILMTARPDEIKLIMVDPKKVELTPYTRLPHMLAPVITEPQGACAALHWLVKEMENRYELLKLLGVRNIEAFNHRVINKQLEAALDREVPAKLPYIVIIIDELADLMMVASQDIETPIARIAQMARAVGIHMIVATQRPSREVITGLIKANFPTRISFKVASRVNSQIVLDEIGAESLLGNGDMLFLPPGTSTLIRAQGAYIRDEDIAAVVKHICDQAPPNYVIPSFDDLGKEESIQKEANSSNGDSLYDQAVDIVHNTGNASTTFLQRKLKIGYARAASLIDEMQAKGVIAASEGNKSRKVLAHANKGEDDIPDLID